MRTMFVGLLLCAATVHASDREMIDPSKLPLLASSVSDFVPSGWRLHEQIEGDLNRDTRPDIVLRLIEDLPSTIDGIPNERQQAIIILLREVDGRLLRAGFSDDILRCTTCYGMLGGEHGNVEIMIEKGVVIINQMWGSRDAVNHTYRFRYDNRVESFLLIGEDIVNTDRLTGRSITTSSNYITGIQVIEEWKVSEDGTEEVMLSSKRARIGKQRKKLEEVKG